MKLIDGLVLQGAPVVIPDSTRNELPELCLKLGLRCGAEIGVYKGLFTKRFCDAGLEMSAVDSWNAYIGSGRSLEDQALQDALFDATTALLSSYRNCTIFRCTSFEASWLFKPESLDFVYIDAGHSFIDVAQDIYYWSQKVRSGGIVAGHDYRCSSPDAPDAATHVGPVVDAYMKAFKINNWYVFGGSSEASEDDIYDDRDLSWMYIK